jgi:hypothetical protein
MFENYTKDFYISIFNKIQESGSKSVSLKTIKGMTGLDDKTSGRILLWLIENTFVAKNSFNDEHPILSKELHNTWGHDFSDLAREKLSCLDLSILDMIFGEDKGVSFDDITFEHTILQPLPDCCYKPCCKGRFDYIISRIRGNDMDDEENELDEELDEDYVQEQVRKSVARLIQYGVIREENERFFSNVSDTSEMLLILHQKRAVCETMKEYLDDIYDDLFDEFDEDEDLEDED